MFSFRKLKRLPISRGRLLPILFLLFIVAFLHGGLSPGREFSRFPSPSFQRQCSHHPKPHNYQPPKPQILLLSEEHRSCDLVRPLLESVRFAYVHSSNLHSLNLYSNSAPQFASIIYCTFSTFKNVSSNAEVKSTLDLYSRAHSVGSIVIAGEDDESSASLDGALVDDLTLVSSRLVDMPSNLAYFVADATILRITKPTSNPIKFSPSNKLKRAFILEPKEMFNHEPIGQILVEGKWETVVTQICQTDKNPTTIFFSLVGMKLFIHQLLLLDSLSSTSQGLLSMALDRHLQIDIDDIFVGTAGTRLGQSDVDAMVDFTNHWRKVIPDFHFVIGFSGKFIYRGNETESLGEKHLLARKDSFRWFGHMWSHMKSIVFETEDSLCKYQKENLEFAKRHNLPLEAGYAVAPHHAGVFPVHEPLYTCWKNVWDVSVTTTEEYPHLYPARHRRGFIHKGLHVLPRQTCGLYTHTLFYDKFPNGPERLEASIFGGELYQQMVTGEFNVFMTHVQNYGSDRLSLYTFGKLFNFLRETTNLRLLQVPAQDLAKKYFDRYPAEATTPLWTNPCVDKRHLEILPASRVAKCGDLPDFVILGPQKTGTTALMNFLKHHPSIASSFDSPTTYEELQFFSGQAYENGLNWYLDLFPARANRTQLKIFEKSATYFGSLSAIPRLKALLPKAHLVSVLLEPGERAYSWYQHQKAHAIDAAVKYSFDEILHAEESNKAAFDLRQRCLNTGNYTKYINRWLSTFSARQMIFVDGNALKTDPIPLLNRFQKQIDLEDFVDFKKLIQFDNKKGFYCPIQNGKSQCLGISKGRKYPEMEAKSREFLNEFFAESNLALKVLLEKHSKAVPSWMT